MWNLVPVHSMKAYWGSRGVYHRSFLTSALKGGEWLTSRPDRFIPVSAEYESGEAAKSVWTFWRKEQSLVFAGIRTLDRSAHIIVAIPAPIICR
jgi:hypothetical protein